MTIADFILARLAEDDAIARRTGGDTWEEWALGSGDAEHMANWDPARALRENDAKRTLVRLWAQADDVYGGDAGAFMDEALRAIASVYADHPDYREGWRT